MRNLRSSTLSLRCNRSGGSQGFVGSLRHGGIAARIASGVPVRQRRAFAGGAVVSVGLALVLNSLAVSGASGATNPKHKTKRSTTTTTARRPTTHPTTTTSAMPTTTTSTSTTTTSSTTTTTTLSPTTTSITTLPNSLYWVPPSGTLEWDWEIDHPLCNGKEGQTPLQTAATIAATAANPSSNSSCAADMGITSGSAPVAAVDGASAPSTDPTVFDIDGFDNTGTDNADESSSLSSSDSPVVAELHALWRPRDLLHRRGNSRELASGLQRVSGRSVGRQQRLAGEKWLNTNPNGPDYTTLQRIMTARFEMCRNNGFDAVEPDNLDGSENDTGFAITTSEGDEYAERLANEIHASRDVRGAEEFRGSVLGAGTVFRFRDRGAVLPVRRLRRSCSLLRQPQSCARG